MAFSWSKPSNETSSLYQVALDLVSNIDRAGDDVTAEEQLTNRYKHFLAVWKDARDLLAAAARDLERGADIGAITTTCARLTVSDLWKLLHDCVDTLDERGAAFCMAYIKTLLAFLE